MNSRAKLKTEEGSGFLDASLDTKHMENRWLVNNIVKSFGGAWRSGWRNGFPARHKRTIYQDFIYRVLCT